MSKIEWTQQTWNPVVGCTKCSPGCDHCYAERMAKRLKAMGVTKYQDVVDANGWTGVISAEDEYEIERPMRRKKPTLYFACSMGDIFHKHAVHDLERIFNIIYSENRHFFLLLTKRIAEFKKLNDEFELIDGSMKHLGIGVTVCNQAEADEKIPLLLKVPAAMHYLSIEPMLGQIDLSQWLHSDACGCCDFPGPDIPEGQKCPHCHGTGYVTEFDWVICGGETGPGARPMHPDWVRGVRDQCVSANVPFFFKQWGEWSPIVEWDDDVIRAYLIKNKKGVWITPDGLCGDDTTEKWDENFSRMMVRCGKKTAGHAIDGIGWRMVPEVLKKFFGESK